MNDRRADETEAAVDGIRCRRHTEEEIQRSKFIRESSKGTLVKYDRPDDPAVPAEDWDVINGA
jgi:hypothetical protein